MATLSVLIPVYGVEAYLERCLDSVLGQSMRDLEVICVDDGSPDGSLPILERHAARDSRMIVLRHDQNRSLLQARKSAVQQARGRYVMFLDSDDVLAPDACEVAVGLIERHGVDILHFGASVVDCSHGLASPVSEVERFVAPFEGVLSGAEVVDQCFRTKKYGHSLWNKIYRAELCKRTFACVGDEYCCYAEDAVAYALLAHVASTYRGVATKPLIFYHYGRGITGGSFDTLERFDKVCQGAKAASALQAAVERLGAAPELGDVAGSVRGQMLTDAVWAWHQGLPEELGPRGFDVLVSYWGLVEVVRELARTRFHHQDEIARRVEGAECLRVAQRQVRRIGVFYHRITNGGVERLISLEIPIWIRAGFEVVLFTGEPPSPDDFEVPAEVRRRILPSLITPDLGRFEALAKAVTEEQIDVFVHNAGSAHGLLFDVLTIRGMGARVVASVHEFLSSSMYWRDDGMVKKPAVYRLLDRLVVTSRIDALYYRCFGVKVEHISNPLAYDLERTEPATLNGPYVLWMGRLSFEKQYLQALQVFAKVVKEVPNARLFLVGKGETSQPEHEVRAEVRRLGIEGSVVICGYHADPEPFYRLASVYLSTSLHEAMSMALIETRALGVPSVQYALGHQETIRDGRGVVMVRQGDQRACARAVVKILREEDYRRKLGREARESIRDFYRERDVESSWRELFQGLSQPDAPGVPQDEDLRVLFETLLFHYRVGLSFAPPPAPPAPPEASESDRVGQSFAPPPAPPAPPEASESDRVGQSFAPPPAPSQHTPEDLESYRIGRAVTWLPRWVGMVSTSVEEQGWGPSLRHVWNRGKMRVGDLGRKVRGASSTD